MTELHFNFDEPASAAAPRRRSGLGLVVLAVLITAGAWVWALWPAM